MAKCLTAKRLCFFSVCLSTMLFSGCANVGDGVTKVTALEETDEMVYKRELAAAHALIRSLNAPGGKLEDREKSLELLDTFSKNTHDPVVKRFMAERYETGDGLPRDLPVALILYTDAAKAGDYKACKKVIAYYEEGGENSDLVQSAVIACYTIIASAGKGSATESDAMIKLAMAYEQGNIVEKSESEALFWYSAAAYTGNVDAQYIVAEMHFGGHGTEVDLEAAQNWFAQAADGGHAEARRRLTTIEHERMLRDVSAEDRTALLEMGAGTAAEYWRVVSRMNQSGYEQGSQPSLILAFLRDEQAARRTGSSALALMQQRDGAAEAQRLERMRVAAEAKQKENEIIARKYPFIAIFTCGLDGNHHINILVCFAPSGHSRGTQLELMTGNIHSVYQGHNLRNSGGRETRNGFHIDLPLNFYLRAQNASDGLILGLRIIDRVSGEVLLQRQATQYRVVEARN